MKGEKILIELICFVSLYESQQILHSLDSFFWPRKRMNRSLGQSPILNEKRLLCRYDLESLSADRQARILSSANRENALNIKLHKKTLPA